MDDDSWQQLVTDAASQGIHPAQRVLEAKLADESEVLRALAEADGLAFRQDLDEATAPSQFTEHIPIAFARLHRIVAIESQNDILTLATSDPFGGYVSDNIGKVTGCAVRIVLAPTEQVRAVIDRSYESRDTQVDLHVEALDTEQSIEELTQLPLGEDLLDVASKAPVVKLVNSVLLEAAKRRASDVHVQPYQDRLQIRFRIDGILYDRYRIPKPWQEAICSRVKIMGQMNIAEKRLAQDGRCTVFVGGKEIDLRIASLPTSFGERVVLRLLDLSARLYELDELGMSEADRKRFARLLGFSHGIVLVTGPTGSGKSTTLYAALQELNCQEKNIITIEDPIEYQLPGISQTQVAARKGVTFATALRHVLRQDPDVIMVGEIRDEETARMAVQSALTGHLVFSTLHTNDSASAVTRLLELRVEPYLVASSVVAVLAQRLVRRACAECKAPVPSDHSGLADLGLTDSVAQDAELYEGTGCPSCFGTGYQGRIGIFELLTVDEQIRQLIMNRAKASTIKAAALDGGMQTLRQDGAAKVLEGITSCEEVLRVTQVDTF
jgi:general secretion pathway protein E